MQELWDCSWLNVFIQTDLSFSPQESLPVVVFGNSAGIRISKLCRALPSKKLLRPNAISQGGADRGLQTWAFFLPISGRRILKDFIGNCTMKLGGKKDTISLAVISRQGRSHA